MKLLPEPREPFQALLEDLFAGGIEAARLRALVQELTRLAAHLRPLLEVLEQGSAAPHLGAPALSSQP